MEIFMVRFTCLDDIKHFVDASCAQSFEVNAVSGRHIINAKSITGMFCVVLEKPVQIEVRGAEKEEYENFYKSVEKLAVI